MTHKRSPKSLQKRAVRKLVHDNSFHDPIQAEHVNVLTMHDIIDGLRDKFPFIHMDIIETCRGEVIIDSRGTGSFQT